MEGSWRGYGAGSGIPSQGTRPARRDRVCKVFLTKKGGVGMDFKSLEKLRNIVRDANRIKGMADEEEIRWLREKMACIRRRMKSDAREVRAIRTRMAELRLARVKGGS